MTRLQQSTFRRVAGLGVSLVAVFAVGSLISAPEARAAFTTIVDSKGFELPKFDPNFMGMGITTTGQLEGQAPFPEPLPVGTWLRTKAGNNSLAVVENTIFAPGGGTQAVKVTAANRYFS